MLTTLGVFADSAGAYEADKASTHTLWAMPIAERLAADENRRGEYYANKIKEFLVENKTANPGGTVFIGASQTDRFPLATAFPDKNVYNRGVGGDRIEGVLERLDCTVLALKPSAINLLIGTNDVLWPVDYKNGNLKPGFERLFRALRETAPQAKLTCFTILPINKEADRLGTCIQDVKTANIQLCECCKEYGVDLIDAYSEFAAKDGTFKPGLSTDGIHLTLDGYLTWLDMIVETTDERIAVWQNLASEYAQIAKDTETITGTNIFRDNHSLILFRTDDNAQTTSTQTNEWGYEVQVRNGKVTAVGAAGNMPIPQWPDGYVLSGIDKQGAWLKQHGTLGATVNLSVDCKTVTINALPKTELTYSDLRTLLLLQMVKTPKSSELKELAKQVDSARTKPLNQDDAKKLVHAIANVDQ